MVDTTRRTNDPAIRTQTTTNTTTAAGTTTSARANDYRDTTATRTTTTPTSTVNNASAAKKGLTIGVLTFLALTLFDWLSGPSLSSLEALTFLDVVIYAVVGVIVGLAVKLIDLQRQKSHRTDTATHRI
ncbi:hypothetical protein [Parvularcula maris]|uniref:Uncharacterized protein n=1 Tax=Parvularcula maris TaxID=2965077 RepID=A0A9X2L874_9PROT|nr:hypothetical protein [Parvularcula maris]MCQ8184885.1 hypothetical protein [Parvularcula maris]